MKKILLVALIAVFGLGGVAATTGCKIKREKDKRWKKDKRYKRDKKWKKHKQKAERVKLKEFFGDKENKYLDYVPIKIGQSRSSAKSWFGKKGKRKFKCEEGKYSVKANYDEDDKVKEIKVNFEVDKETIVSWAKKKWGEPKKTNAKRIKWVKDELKIIVKRKGGKTKLIIKKNKKKKKKAGDTGDKDAKEGMDAKKGSMDAKEGMDAKKGGMDAKKGMLPKPADDDDDDD